MLFKHKTILTRYVNPLDMAIGELTIKTRKIILKHKTFCPLQQQSLSFTTTILYPGSHSNLYSIKMLRFEIE